MHLLLHYAVFLPQPHTGGDNAGYLTLAKSLLERHEYRDLYDSTEPVHTQYPPVYPLILAVGIALGLKPWVQFKIITIAFSALAVAFTYLWIRRRGRLELALGVAAILAVAPGVLDQGHWVLSDVPFWGITMVAVWAWQRVPDGFNSRFAIAVIMTVVAYFTRSAGLPLLIGASAFLLWRRRWSQLAVFAAAIGPLAFLWWLRAKQKGGVDYVSQFWSLDPYNPALGKIHFFDLFTRMRDNGGHYISRHLPMLLFGREGLVALSTLILLLGVYGWAVRMRKPGVSELFLPLYIGLLLVWPAVWSGERFLLPALPFILFYAGDAIARLTRLVVRSGTSIPAFVACLLLILFGLPATTQAHRMSSLCMEEYRGGDRYACLPEPYKDYYHIAELSKRILPDHSAVLSRKARSFYIISGGVPGRQFPLSDDPEKFFAEARAAKARYVVYDGLDALSQAYVVPTLLKHSGAFCILFSLGQERAAVFGIDLAGANAFVQSPGTGAFKPCGDEYWKNTAVKDSMQQGLIR
ncbi:MAG TPA: hypothetical protein VM100_11340 [Longimicrobiales bacterium]|nr:hypothetical protein [Longimicrobiales bacterium]